MDRRKFFVMVGAAIAGMGMGANGYAQGGYVSRDMVGMTGERGPEFVLPANSPFIVAIGQGRVIGSGGGGGGTVSWQS